jgi:phage terminase small subunit
MPAQDGLTAKQRRFVEEYLVDLNATEAAIRAGYSKRTARQMGAENLSKPVIAEAIRIAMAGRSQRTKITSDRVLEELGIIAFSDMRKFATWGASGVKLNDSNTLPEDAARCVAEVAESPGKYGRSLRFKLHDKVAALEKIAKHLGMFGENAGDDFSDLARMSDEELDKVRRKLKLVS